MISKIKVRYVERMRSTMTENINISNSVLSMLLRNFRKLPSNAYKKRVFLGFFTSLYFQTIEMASNQPQEYDEQFQFLQECYPEESMDKLLGLLCEYDGDVDQVEFIEFLHLF